MVDVHPMSFCDFFKNYLQVREMQDSILQQYEDDFGKYATSSDLARIRMVWNSIPM